MRVEAINRAVDRPSLTVHMYPYTFGQQGVVQPGGGGAEMSLVGGGGGGGSDMSLVGGGGLEIGFFGQHGTF